MSNIQLEHNQLHTQEQKFPICFLAHDMESPANIGSLFRLADALGVEKLYLSGNTPIPPNQKIKKAARSTEKHVPYDVVDNPVNLVTQLKFAGYKIISLEITTSSTDIRRLSVNGNEKICLVLGSENTGVPQELLDLSDDTIHIPMLGKNSSMNVATACAIATFEIIRRYLPR